MWINSVKLKNVGVYIDENEFDFNSDLSFNVISGENGHGKTTFLTSIIAGLYGSEMYGSTNITKMYKERILNLFAQNPSDNEMVIEIDFNHLNSSYVITRKFVFDGDDFLEDYSCIVDNKKDLKFTMNSIISRSYFEFFFFDGETILSTITDGKIHEYIDDFINVAFELDVFEVLRSDLDKSLVKEFNKLSSDNYKKTKKEIVQLDKRLNIIDAEIKFVNEEISLKDTMLKMVNHDIDKLGLLKRDELKDLIKRNDELKAELKEFNLKSTEILKGDINLHLHSSLIKNVDVSLAKTRKERAESLKQAYIKLDAFYEVEVSLDVEREIANNAINSDDKIKSDIKVLIDEYRKAEADVVKNKKLLAKQNDGVLYNSYMDNLELIESEKHDLEIKLTKLNKEQALVKTQKDKLIVLVNKEEKKLLNSNLTENAFVVKQKAINVINEYLETKKAEVTKEIEIETLNILNDSLMRKKDYITEIQITPEEILLYSNGQKQNIKYISSGEKQVVIVALVLAIIKSAKVSTSLVLDTFIGRLDPVHTKNLLSFLAHDIDNQILILTTSSEMGQTEIDYIAKDLSSYYKLDNKNGRTTINKGAL